MYYSDNAGGIPPVAIEGGEGVEGANGIVERSPSGRYLRFREKLGSGAFKDVYRGYDTRKGVEVAWNVVSLVGIPKQDRTRIVNEVRLLERLCHPYIISFHGSWVIRERQEVHFVTEILSSGTLKSFVMKVQEVRWKVAKRWLIQILEGLQYIHSQGVIHRDLKCDNIFINGASGDLRIGDMGLCTVQRTGGPAHSVLGTPEFMAPDMYEENVSYDEKIDIYAFGMCMLEICTHETPYAECTAPAQIYRKVSKGEYPQSLYRIRSTEARDFILLCLGSKDTSRGSTYVRPSATQLLSHPFLIPNDNDEDLILIDSPTDVSPASIILSKPRKTNGSPHVSSSSSQGRSRGNNPFTVASNSVGTTLGSISSGGSRGSRGSRGSCGKREVGNIMRSISSGEVTSISSRGLFGSREVASNALGTTMGSSSSRGSRKVVSNTLWATKGSISSIGSREVASSVVGTTMGSISSRGSRGSHGSHGFAFLSHEPSHRQSSQLKQGGRTDKIDDNVVDEFYQMPQIESKFSDNKGSILAGYGNALKVDKDVEKQQKQELQQNLWQQPRYQDTSSTTSASSSSSLQSRGISNSLTIGTVPMLPSFAVESNAFQQVHDNKFIHEEQLLLQSQAVGQSPPNPKPSSLGVSSQAMQDEQQYQIQLQLKQQQQQLQEKILSQQQQQLQQLQQHQQKLLLQRQQQQSQKQEQEQEHQQQQFLQQHPGQKLQKHNNDGFMEKEKDIQKKEQAVGLGCVQSASNCTLLSLNVKVPVQGQVQNVQFNFDLIKDDPIKVAKEMILEFGMPQESILEISEMISSLILGARIKYNMNAAT